MVSLFKLTPFFRNRKLHAAPNENQAMELGVADGASDVESLGIADELGDGGLSCGFNFSIGSRGRQILQLQKETSYRQSLCILLHLCLEKV